MHLKLDIDSYTDSFVSTSSASTSWILCRTRRLFLCRIFRSKLVELKAQYVYVCVVPSYIELRWTLCNDSERQGCESKQTNDSSHPKSAKSLPSRQRLALPPLITKDWATVTTAMYMAQTQFWSFEGKIAVRDSQRFQCSKLRSTYGFCSNEGHGWFMFEGHFFLLFSSDFLIFRESMAHKLLKIGQHLLIPLTKVTTITFGWQGIDWTIVAKQHSNLGSFNEQNGIPADSLATRSAATARPPSNKMKRRHSVYSVSHTTLRTYHHSSHLFACNGQYFFILSNDIMDVGKLPHSSARENPWSSCRLRTAPMLTCILFTDYCWSVKIKHSDIRWYKMIWVQYMQLRSDQWCIVMHGVVFRFECFAAFSWSRFARWSLPGRSLASFTTRTPSRPVAVEDHWGDWKHSNCFFFFFSGADFSFTFLNNVYTENVKVYGVYMVLPWRARRKFGNSKRPSSTM